MKTKHESKLVKEKGYRGTVHTHLIYRGVKIRCVESNLPHIEVNLAGLNLPHMATLNACAGFCTGEGITKHKPSLLARGRTYRSVRAAKIAVLTYLNKGFKPYEGQLLRKEIAVA